MCQQTASGMMEPQLPRGGLGSAPLRRLLRSDKVSGSCLKKKSSVGRLGNAAL